MTPENRARQMADYIVNLIIEHIEQDYPVELTVDKLTTIFAVNIREAIANALVKIGGGG